MATRTALTGTSSLLDALVLCPGLHKQQSAPQLNCAEFPACAAMTTGYVFRVENPATVLYMQKVAQTGHLTTLSVSGASIDTQARLAMLAFSFGRDRASSISTLTYLLCVALTAAVILLLAQLRDWWALVVLSILILARLLNVIVIQRRAGVGWKGVSEPGVQGDLLILLSYDRWIRLQGAVDDLKAVTSGSWLREAKFWESSLVAFATFLVYLDAALAANARQEGKMLLLILFFASAGLLGVANEYTEVLQMHGKFVAVKRRAVPYKRRLDLAQELIKETGRDDWALQLGMIRPTSEEGKKRAGKVTM